MPIYEYKCSKCGVFEAMQGIKEAPLKRCPTCKGKVERLISRGSFILKGSGWYATDYARGKSSGADSDSSASTSTTNGSAAGDSSSKPAESKPAESTASSSESKPAKSKSSAEKSVAAKSAD